MRNTIITIAAGLMLMTVTSGCASWTSSKPKDKNSMWSRMQFWKKPYQRPQKMAAIWTHDILTMTGKPPTRGFGGRIYFYNEKSQAIPVDGELIVHGYEDSKSQRSDAEKTKADKTFMFTAEQFTEHFSSSELGASYSVWIPWDEADGMQTQITLIPTFKGTDGSLVQGEPAKLILPGRTIEEPTRSTPFQQVSYEQSEMPTADGPLPVLGGMKTTTITRASKVNQASKKTVQKTTPEAQPSARPNLNLGYTTEVRYGNDPMTATGSQPASRALSLYPNQPVAMNDAQNATQNVSQNVAQNAAMQMQMQNAMVAGQLTNSHPGVSANTTYPGSAYPSAMLTPGAPANIPYPGTMPNMTPGVKPTIQPVQPTMNSPAFQVQPTVPATMPNPAAPGFAGFAPVQPQAVQSAFATQWQPFGQAPIPLIQQPQQNPLQNPHQQSAVQQAGFSQSPTAGQALGQPQAMQPGQSNSQMLNRY